MSYARPQQITPIDMLPELEDIDTPQPYDRAVKGPQIKSSRYPGDGFIPQEQAQRVQKVIRENHVAPQDSGMTYRPPVQNQLFSPDDQPEGTDDSYTPPRQQAQYYPTAMQPSEPTCIDCARHAAGCPVCKSYFGNDKTIYIIAIIVLTAICLLLLKKVLDT